MLKTVAYIVVGWNNEDILAECFDSILSQTYSNRKIIYVDNDSNDSSVELVIKKYKEIQIIKPGVNTGFARGNNIGIKEALKDPEVAYIVLLNSDARLDKTWTDTIVKFAENKPKGAQFQGTTLDYYNRNTVDSTHTFIARNGQGTQGNWRKTYVHDNGPKRVFGVNAAACLISRTFIEAQPFGDLFDEQMFMYLEDVDLSTRAIVLGWDNYLVRGAKAYHMGSASSGKNPGFSLYMTFRNNTALLIKNLPLSILIRILPNLIRGDIDTVKELLRQGKKSAAKKVITGRLVGVLRSVIFIRKRILIRKKKHVSTRRLWKLMSKGY